MPADATDGARWLREWASVGALLDRPSEGAAPPMSSPMAVPLGVLMFYVVYTFAGVRADQPGCHPACTLDFNCTTVPLGVAYSDDLIIKCKSRPSLLHQDRLAVGLTAHRCVNACRWDEAEKDQPSARTLTQNHAGIGQEHCRVHADDDRSRRPQCGRATRGTGLPEARATYVMMNYAINPPKPCLWQAPPWPPRSPKRIHVAVGRSAPSSQ